MWAAAATDTTAIQTPGPGSWSAKKIRREGSANAAASPGSTVAEDLLWTAAGGGDPEIVRLALERIDWPRDDERWMGALWQAFTCDAGVERAGRRQP